ncbi:MAG: hypothetical protein ACK5VI_09500 [Opitutia bacterium]
MSDELPYIFAAATPEQQAIAQQSALYKKGDMSLVWMNDSALAELFLPKAEVDARIDWARQSALSEAVRRARHYATIVPMHGSLKSDIYEAAGQAATEIAASIEALSDTPSGMVLVPRDREDETRAAKILAERNQLIGILQLAVEQNGDKEKEPAWFVAACRILNAGFTKAVKAGEGNV